MKLNDSWLWTGLETSANGVVMLMERWEWEIGGEVSIKS